MQGNTTAAVAATTEQADSRDKQAAGNQTFHIGWLNVTFVSYTINI